MAFFDFTLSTAIMFLDIFLLVIFVFFIFYSTHIKSVLFKYLSNRSKVMTILDSQFKFSYFVVFILFAAILIKILIGIPIVADGKEGSYEKVFLFS